jgi:hypothetical protein
MNRSVFLFPALPVVLFLLISAPVLAQTAPTPPTNPLHLSVTKPLTPVRDVLASLSQQSGTPVLADDTVIDTLGVGTIDKPTLPEMLEAIKSLLPALTWQRVSIPGDAPVPNANALSEEVRTLNGLAGTMLTIEDPDAKTGLSFARTPADLSITPGGTVKTVYLVTNETVRAQREATAKAKAATAQTTTPLNQTVGGLQNVATAFGQLTPDQQRTALPQMMQQFQQIMRSIDPSVIQDLRTQAQQNGGNPFGGRMGGGPPPGQ